MKKYISIILSILCILSLVGCNKNIETMYQLGIMVNGVFYEKSAQPMPAEVNESAIMGYIESYTDTIPEKNGETNISKDLIDAPYAKVEGGIAILYQNEWYLCKAETSSGAPLAPDVSDKDLESVSYIEVMSGLTGQRIKVKDTDGVQKVLDDIESLKYEKKNAVEEVGYAYRIRFYNENDDELGRIFVTEENGHQISYDGYYYLIEANQNINVDFLEELLVDAPPAEPGDEGNDELPDKEAEETIIYNEKEYKKSELCDATLQWLELSEQERMLSSYFPPEFRIFEETWGINLTAENITSTSATIKCVQSGGEPTGELHTGSWFILENWTEENGWKEMPYVVEGDIAWTEEAWMITINDVCEWDINWEYLYGAIPEGKYRIGKEITDFRATGDFDKAFYYAEFKITK